MDPSASGNAKDPSCLDETDRAALALFEEANAGDRFGWPDAELNARLGKKKQQQLCKARRLLNTRNLEQIQASAAIAAAPALTPAQSSASGIQAWTDGVRERELRGHTSRVVTVSIDGDLLASVDVQCVAKLWNLRSAECICTWQLSGRGP